MQRRSEQLSHPAVAEDFEAIDDVGIRIGADGLPLSRFHRLENWAAGKRRNVLYEVLAVIDLDCSLSRPRDDVSADFWVERAQIQSDAVDGERQRSQPEAQAGDQLSFIGIAAFGAGEPFNKVDLTTLGHLRPIRQRARQAPGFVLWHAANILRLD